MKLKLRSALVSALERLVRQTRETAGLACTFRNEGAVAIRDPQKALHLFRIAQEAVTNAVKHARGRHRGVTLGRRRFPHFAYPGRWRRPTRRDGRRGRRIGCAAHGAIGGGRHSWQAIGPVTVSNSRFNGNTAGESGGAIGRGGLSPTSSSSAASKPSVNSGAAEPPRNNDFW